MNLDDPYDVAVFLVVVVARLGVPLAIPRSPLPAVLAALAVDAVDHTVFQSFTDIQLDGYQTYDKALDVYYLTIAYASTIRNWDGGPAFGIGRALWYYRLVGVVLFEYADARWLLMVFPNTFEYYFVAIEGLKVSRNPFALTRRQLAGLAAAIWVLVKLPQEWWIHVAQLDFTDFVKEHLFGVPLEDGWGDALSNRPLVAVLVVAGAVLVLLLLRRASRLLPPRDWEPTWSADEQALNMGWSAPPTDAVPSAFFGWQFVEKAALVTLVTLIFERILPGSDRSVLQVTVGNTAVIAVSTLVSQWLARRGITWRSLAGEFLAMGAANTGIALAVGFLLPGGGSRPALGTFLFLVGLLTLIVVLFDHFKRIDRERVRRTWRLRSAVRI